MVNSKMEQLFTALVPMGKMSDIADRLEAKNVQLEAELPPTAPWWVALVPNLIFVVLIALLWLFYYEPDARKQ